MRIVTTHMFTILTSNIYCTIMKMNLKIMRHSLQSVCAFFYNLNFIEWCTRVQTIRISLNFYQSVWNALLNVTSEPCKQFSTISFQTQMLRELKILGNIFGVSAFRKFTSRAEFIYSLASWFMCLHRRPIKFVVTDIFLKFKAHLSCRIHL